MKGVFAMCLASKYINNLEEALGDIEDLKNDLCKQMEKYDNEINKFYHDLETKSFNAAEGYYLSKQLQELLQKRRVVKKEINKLRVVSKGIDRNAVKQEIDKASERLNQSLRNSDESQYMKNFKFKKLEDFYDKEFKEVH